MANQAHNDERVLKVRVTDAEYRALRLFAIAQEDQTAARVTHQEILSAALASYISGQEAWFG